MATRMIMTEILWCETKHNSRNEITLRIHGRNSNGTRIEWVLEDLATYEIAHLADEAAMAIAKVRKSLKRELDAIKQSCE